MRIANNIMALNAFNSLSKTEKSFQRVINSLSTGLRMNSASDDAAGFAISERLRSQIGGIDTALRNSQDGISLLQTAEGALEQVNSMLQRMRDLSIQASNDSLTSNDRQYIQLEINQLKDEIDRIAGTTQFNKKRILDGSSGALWASSDPGVRARINGGLTHIDNFGQKVSAEGNYRIDIHSTPGKNQVYASGKFKVFTMTPETTTDEEGNETYTENVHVNTLREMPQFYTGNEAFIVEVPQSMAVIQGDGATASIMLYGEDTLYDVAGRLNDAISETLGQGRYTESSDKFCMVSDGELNPVYGDDGSITGYELSAGLIVQSVLPGRDGELYFAGNDEVIQALGLTVIQASAESEYNISVYDAHSGEAVATDIKITGNILHEVIAANVDVQFDPMAGTSAAWNESEGKYALSGSDMYSGVLHLENSGIIFQVGTNQAENFAVQLGDVSTIGLYVDGVSVMTRELASRSIGIIDEAIDTVVKNRTQISSYASALEHSAANLSISGANLTSSRGRLTDADEAKSTMRFIEFQILSHAQNTVLAQANQQPEAVYSLINRNE